MTSPANAAFVAAQQVPRDGDREMVLRTAVCSLQSAAQVQWSTVARNQTSESGGCGVRAGGPAVTSWLSCVAHEQRETWFWTTSGVGYSGQSRPRG